MRVETRGQRGSKTLPCHPWEFSGRIASQCAALFTGVLQIGRTSNDLARVAGDCAQVLVDCLEIAVGHVPEEWPSHDQEKIAVEGWLDTIGRSAGGSAIWVYVIEIGAHPHDLDELLVSAPTFRQSRFVRCQIAGVKVRKCAD